VISVVALDQNGDRLKGAHPTQYGTAFDVAASGMATSTLYGDWIGTMGRHVGGRSVRHGAGRLNQIEGARSDADASAVEGTHPGNG
jgi:hypothetical protein